MESLHIPQHSLCSGDCSTHSTPLRAAFWSFTLKICRWAWSPEVSELLCRFLKHFSTCLPLFCYSILQISVTTDPLNSPFYLFRGAKPPHSAWVSPFPVPWTGKCLPRGSQADLNAPFTCFPSLPAHSPGMPVVPKPANSWIHLFCPVF